MIKAENNFFPFGGLSEITLRHVFLGHLFSHSSLETFGEHFIDKSQSNCVSTQHVFPSELLNFIISLKLPAYIRRYA